MRRLIDSKGYQWIAGHTTVSDLSSEQRRTLLGYAKPEGYDRWLAEQPKLTADPKMIFPTRFDWRDSGIMTPVKKQGSCGSCWDFAATAAAWEYPPRTLVKQLNSRSLLDWRANEWIAIEEMGGHWLVKYRHQYVREIDLETVRTRGRVRPVSKFPD